MSRYSSTSSHGYQPLSPPWSQGSSPLPPHFEGPPRAPVMPYVALPPVDHDGYAPHAHGSPHHGLITPPPSEPHPVLCARSTVVRYDFATHPHTLRMSSSAPNPTFPGGEAASRPAQSFVYIECEATQHTITVGSDSRTGISCLGVLSQLHAHFAQNIHPVEWQRVRDPELRNAMKTAYSRRTGRAYDQHATMKMIDYLMGRTIFKRLVPKRNDASGSTWVLQTC